MANNNNQSFDNTQSQPFDDAQGKPVNTGAGDQGSGSLTDRLNNVAQASPGQPPQNLPGAAPASAPQDKLVPEPGPAAADQQQPRTMMTDMGQMTPPAAPANQPSFTPAGIDANEPMFTPETANGMEMEPDIAGSKSHTLWWILGIVMGIIILGLIGYFVVYPIFSSGEPVINPPVAEQPATEDQPGQSELLSHTSAFKGAPQGQITVSLDGTVTSAAVTTTLRREAAELPDGLTEIIFTDGAGNQVPFGQFVAAVAPSLGDQESTAALFADDFTAFIYKNADGIWPGYIGKLDATDPAALTAWFEALEASSLGEFFVTSPGDFQEFRNGTVLGLPDRFAPTETAGASLGYLANETEVLISTSFEGMKEAIRLLGWAS